MFDSKAGVSPSPGLAVHSGTKHMVEAVAEAVRQEVSWHPWLYPCGIVFWIYLAKLLDLSWTGEGVRGEGGHCETGRNCHSRLWPCGWQQSEQARLSFSCCCHNYCLLLSQICCCWCHSHCYCYCDHHHHQDQCSREVAAGLGCWVPADTSGCLRPEVVAAQVSFDVVASKGSTRMSFLLYDNILHRVYMWTIWNHNPTSRWWTWCRLSTMEQTWRRSASSAPSLIFVLKMYWDIAAFELIRIYPFMWRHVVFIMQ